MLAVLLSPMPAAAMLAVLLSPMPAAAMLVVLLSLSPLLLLSPCRCGRAHRNGTRRSPVPPPCSPSRHAAVAVPAAAMPAVLRSLCRPPPCSSCISRCPRYRYARRKAVAGLAEMLADGRPRR
ncbi:hypothetical protein PF010_g32549 [Phytophthora fragariae]|uniref:Uncharacterized protein n=1 Tax=Phytophthora fragariae TaxID=53985 RepID=A0A6G0JEA2_9STRA|nr:hypothetical protein PF010_g32549 [Phytophthora fragariae]